eukprot:7020547-Prymnesium_polylepis.1
MAYVAVRGDRVLRLQDLEALLEVLTRLRVVDRAQEEGHVPRERVLVHRVDVAHVGDGEEEDRRAVRDLSTWQSGEGHVASGRRSRGQREK